MGLWGFEPLNGQHYQRYTQKAHSSGKYVIGYDVQIVTISPPVFAQLTFTEPTTSYVSQ